MPVGRGRRIPAGALLLTALSTTFEVAINDAMAGIDAAVAAVPLPPNGSVDVDGGGMTGVGEGAVPEDSQLAPPPAAALREALGARRRYPTAGDTPPPPAPNKSAVVFAVFVVVVVPNGLGAVVDDEVGGGGGELDLPSLVMARPGFFFQATHTYSTRIKPYHIHL